MSRYTEKLNKLKIYEKGLLAISTLTSNCLIWISSLQLVSTSSHLDYLLGILLFVWCIFCCKNSPVYQFLQFCRFVAKVRILLLKQYPLVSTLFREDRTMSVFVDYRNFFQNKGIMLEDYFKLHLESNQEAKMRYINLRRT